MPDKEIQAIDEIQHITIYDMLNMSDEEIQQTVDSSRMVLDTIEPRIRKIWEDLPDTPDIPDDVCSIPDLTTFTFNSHCDPNVMSCIPGDILSHFLHLDARYKVIKSNIRIMNVFLSSERDPFMIMGLEDLGY